MRVVDDRKGTLLAGMFPEFMELLYAQSLSSVPVLLLRAAAGQVFMPLCALLSFSQF